MPATVLPEADECLGGVALELDCEIPVAIVALRDDAARDLDAFDDSSPAGVTILSPVPQPTTLNSRGSTSDQ